MFLSRLTFHTLPGKTEEVEGNLMTLLKWVEEAGGTKSKSDADTLRLIGRARFDVRARGPRSWDARTANFEDKTKQGFSRLVAAGVRTLKGVVETRAI